MALCAHHQGLLGPLKDLIFTLRGLGAVGGF